MSGELRINDILIMKSLIAPELRTLLTGLLLSLCCMPLLPAADRHVPADYSTIQAAVDASDPGDTIRIAPGDYYQQIVIVDKASLILAGEPGAVIHAWNGMTQTLAPYGSTAIVSLGLVRSHVVVAGLTFHGESLGGSYPNSFYGILFRGSSGQVTNCTVRSFRAFSSPVGRGINVANLVSFGPSVVDVAVLNSTFADNNRSINLSGDDGLNNATLLRTRFTIEGNTFTGLGPASTLVNYGIVIFTGAGGEVKSNTMTGYSYAGTATGFSSAIHAFDGLFATNRPFVPVRAVRYERNIFSANDHHLVMVSANDSTVVSNQFQATSSGVRRWGCLAFSGTNVVVAQNDFSDTPIGVELFGGDLNGSVLRGVATNPNLHTNRFCGVYTPIHAQPLASGIQEVSTELCTNSPAPRVIQVPAEYSTIQEAVNAADPGDTIHIAAGDYHEQVTIANKGRLNLVGEPGTVIHTTTGMTETLLPYSWLWYRLVAVYRTEVMISGITLEGHQHGDLYQGPGTGLIGIYFIGSSGQVTNCTVRGFRGTTLTTETDACAVQVFNPVLVGSSEVHFSVCASAFADNETSVLLRGDPGANPAVRRVTTVIKENSITGLGSVPFPNQGVSIVCGVTGHVFANRLTQHGSAAIDAYDAAAQSHGQFIPLQPINYEQNILSNNVQHLRLFGGNESRVINNIFLGHGAINQDDAGVVLSGTNIVTANNNFSDRPLGILLVGSGTWEDWPAFPPAARPTLAANWFCNVPEPIRVDTNLVIGLHEQGTAQCESGPLQPIFQSTRNSNGTGAALTLRAWHGDSVVIEASSNLETNLVNWVQIYTNTVSLPTFDFHDTNDVGAARRFYRALKP